MNTLEELQKRIGYAFKNRALLDRARTHRSFSADHNERLEFLGDSVLNCTIGYALFLREDHFDEGVLSRVRANLVCEKTLNEIGQTLGVSDFLRMGEGEVRNGGAHRPSIVADAMERIFGAVFMDSGFDAAKEVILRLYEPILHGLTSERLSKDPKTALQERLQGQHLARPTYTVVEVSGLAHAQHFKVRCAIEPLEVQTFGEGGSRRRAEQAAASEALTLVTPMLAGKKRKK